MQVSIQPSARSHFSPSRVPPVLGLPAKFNSVEVVDPTLRGCNRLTYLRLRGCNPRVMRSAKDTPETDVSALAQNQGGGIDSTPLRSPDTWPPL